VDQPAWRELATVDDALQFAENVAFPVLVRPSFVLSGAAMNVASNAAQLTAYLRDATAVSGDKPVVVSKFITNAKEIEFDAVACGGKILNYAISEHVENAGVHSGDATLVLPAQKLYQETVRRIKKIGQAIAQALHITGPFNVQLMAKANAIKVIECNLRASRTFPFISKTLNANFIVLATKAMLGLPVKPYSISLGDIDYVGVKCAMFSFTRLRGADPVLGVEMSSTGEVACFGDNVHEAYRLALESAGFNLPQPGANVLVSIAKSDVDATLDRRYEFIESMRTLQALGFVLFGTPGTADYYTKVGVKIEAVSKPDDAEEVAAGGGAGGLLRTASVSEVKLAAHAAGANPRPPSPGGRRSCIDIIKKDEFGLVINVPEGSRRPLDTVSNGYLIRRTTVDFGVALLTNVKTARMYVEAEARHRAATAAGPLAPPKTMGEFYKQGVEF